MQRIVSSSIVAVLWIVSGCAYPVHAQSPSANLQSQVDAIFNRWNTATPGCAVGASVKGETVVKSAYGMADLERSIPNTPATVFDAGSVAKQFTAVAVLLLE